MFMDNTKNRPRFLVVDSANEDLPEGLSGYCQNPEEYQETERRFVLGGVQRGPRPKTCSRQLNHFVNSPVRVSVHKTLKFSRGVIRCQDLADMSEVEIQDELKDQGMVGVN